MLNLPLIIEKEKFYKKIIKVFFLFFIVFNTSVFSQNIFNVADSTIVLEHKDKQTFMYGLAEGDKVIFNFSEQDAKEIDEIEVFQNLSKTFLYQDFLKSKVVNKEIIIPKTDIYYFKFISKQPRNLICRFKIQRIPASEKTKNLDLKIYWEPKCDTMYYIETEKKLISSDTLLVPIIENKVVSLNKKSNDNLNKNYFKINIPDSIIGWSYFIGVGKKSEKIFKELEAKAEKQKENIKGVSNLTNNSKYLTFLALNRWSDTLVPKSTDSVKFWFVRFDQNLQNFINEKEFNSFGKSNGYFLAKRMNFPINDSFYVCLKNESIKEKLNNVHIKIYAIALKEKWEINKIRKSKPRHWNQPKLKN